MAEQLLLVQMAGNSGAGKSSLAQMIGARINAAVIDYDVVKSAALDAGTDWDTAGRVGYGVSRALAAALLQQGRSVILDSPCRFQQIVDAGIAIAAQRGATYAFVECALVDRDELRRRMSSRARQRSHRTAFDLPPPDAPNDAMADATGTIRLMETKTPTSPWISIDMRQPLTRCCAQALAYLASLDQTSVR